MTLWSIDDMADFFKVDRRTVAEKWVSKPGFPPPMFAPTRWARRWSREEVINWATPKERKREQKWSATT